MFDFDRSPVVVAQELLGAYLTFRGVTVRLTETEAYDGENDPAAHAFKGPRQATAALFGPPGSLYCYLSYGVHICGNLVCGRAGGGSAVLLRAGEITAGIEIARQRRWGTTTGRPDAALGRGPGCLGQAMGWTLADNFLLAGQDFTIQARTTTPLIHSGPRVGVSQASRRPWRFWLDDSTVSNYQASPRAGDDW